MGRVLDLYRSSLGKKFIVAVTGIMMLGFLIGHMAGNLKVFLPAVEGIPDIDVYAHYLREIGVPLLPHGGALLVARLVLLGSLILHVVCVLQLSVGNQAARPTAYDHQKFARATRPARWMMVTGLYLLAFVIFHLMHLTLGWLEPAKFEHGQVYDNLQSAFSRFGWAGIYLVSMAVVALHLYHGVWSLFQTVGWDNPDRNPGLRKLAVTLAVVLFIGFVAVPSAFLMNVLKPADAVTQQESGAKLSATMHKQNLQNND